MSHSLPIGAFLVSTICGSEFVQPPSAVKENNQPMTLHACASNFAGPSCILVRCVDLCQHTLARYSRLPYAVLVVCCPFLLFFCTNWPFFDSCWMNAVCDWRIRFCRRRKTSFVGFGKRKKQSQAEQRLVGPIVGIVTGSYTSHTHLHYQAPDGL